MIHHLYNFYKEVIQLFLLDLAVEDFSPHSLGGLEEIQNEIWTGMFHDESKKEKYVTIK